MKKVTMSEESNELVEIRNIPNTPFVLVKENTQDKPRNWIALGNYKVTEEHEKEEDAVKEMKSWQFNLNVIAAMIEIKSNFEKQSKTLSND